MAAINCHVTFRRPALLSPPYLRTTSSNKLFRTSLLLNRTPPLVNSLSKSTKCKWKISCFRQEESSSEFPKPEYIEDEFAEVVKNPVLDQSSHCNSRIDDIVSRLKKTADVILTAEPWTVPWTAKTILQVMLLWIASFWLVGSWIIPFLAHAAGFRKEALTFRGQALYSLLTDVAEGLVGIAILHRCLSKFQPLPSDWFKFNLKGKWHFDVVLGCLMFPLVNRLSQVNLNLLPISSSPVTISSVEQSIVARDPVAMVLYAIVVSVCAPVWEEIVFRGFLLPSLTSFEGSFGTSLDGLDEASSFIEMDPKLPASRRFFRASPDFNFNFPTLDAPVTLVHADELISNGCLLPLFAKQMKMERDDDLAYSTPSTPVPSHAHKNMGSDSKEHCSSFKRCRRSSKRILRKCLELVTPVFQKFGGRSSGLKTEAGDQRKRGENRFVCSASTSPRISVAYSVDNWRRSCDYESSIHEAVLHCKRSIGK